MLMRVLGMFPKRSFNDPDQLHAYQKELVDQLENRLFQGSHVFDLSAASTALKVLACGGSTAYSDHQIGVPTKEAAGLARRPDIEIVAEQDTKWRSMLTVKPITSGQVLTKVNIDSDYVDQRIRWLAREMDKSVVAFRHGDATQPGAQWSIIEADAQSHSTTPQTMTYNENSGFQWQMPLTQALDQALINDDIYGYSAHRRLCGDPRMRIAALVNNVVDDTASMDDYETQAFLDELEAEGQAQVLGVPVTMQEIDHLETPDLNDLIALRLHHSDHPQSMQWSMQVDKALSSHIERDAQIMTKDFFESPKLRDDPGLSIA